MDVDSAHDKNTVAPRQTYSLGIEARDLPPSPSTISSKQSYQTPVLKGALIYRIPETHAGQNSLISSILPQHNTLDDSPQLTIGEGIVINVTASNPEPIRLSSVLDDPAHAQHVLIIVDPHVHCTVIDDQRSTPITRYSSHHCEVLAKEGASINLISLKRLDALTFQTCRRVGIAERNARITWQSFELGQGQSHLRTHPRPS